MSKAARKTYRFKVAGKQHAIRTYRWEGEWDNESYGYETEKGRGAYGFSSREAALKAGLVALGLLGIVCVIVGCGWPIL